MSKIRVKKLHPNAILPTYGSSNAAGADLYACIDSPITVNPHECVKFPTGIAIALPSDLYGAFIFARSGLSVNHGLAPANCVGVVDSDYRGEVIVGLVNQFSQPYTVEPGERIAQMVIMPVSLMPVQECDTLDETDRGAGGFGSSGKK